MSSFSLRSLSAGGAAIAASVGGGGTAGSVLFLGAGPVLAQDNANLFWDATLKRLGIGTVAPTLPLHAVISNALPTTLSSVAAFERVVTAGTPGVGLGVGLRFFLPSDTTAQQNAGQIAYTWAVATHALRRSKAALLVANSAGSSVEALGLETDDTVQYGYFTGAAPGSITLAKLRLGSAPASWSNAAGTFLGVNGQSGFTGNLVELQLNGTRKLSINSSGSIDAAGTLLVGSAFAFTGGNNVLCWSGAGIGWSSSGSVGASDSIETALYRDAADFIAQRRGVNPQGFRVYNTFSDASNYERGFMRWTDNSLEIGCESVGTGAAREVVLGTFNSAGLLICTNNSNRWKWGSGNGDYFPTSDNARDIGLSGSNRPRAIYVAGTTGIMHQAGTSTLEATMVGVANANVVAVGNVGTGEDNLITYSLPANALSATGKGVRITAWGTTANNANAKTLKIYFGTTVILTNALVASIAGTWRVEANVFRSGSNTQDYVAQLLSAGVAGVAVNDVEVGSAAETDTSAIIVKATGDATSNNDIVQEGLLVEFIN